MPLAHALLDAFKAKKPAFGLWLTLPGTLIPHAIAHSPGISWVCFDAEHGLLSLSSEGGSLFSSISALGPNGPSAIVRIPATGSAPESASWQIKRALDAGARGVLVPMVGNAKEASFLASASRFPPRGTRGFGSPLCHNAWGTNMATYLKEADDAVMLLVQIETKDGMKNVDEIAAVPGVDCLFCGPYDLSIAHGIPPPSPDPHPDAEVLAQNILRAAKGAGKAAGIYCTSGAQAARRAAEGWDIINVTSDVGALTEHIGREFGKASGEIGANEQAIRY